jgi:hypothetical protein
MTLTSMDPTDPAVPATLTTEHSQSSYGQAVLLIIGKAYGPRDLPILLHPRQRTVTDEQYQEQYCVDVDPAEAALCERWNDAVVRCGARLGTPEWAAEVNRMWRRIVAALGAAAEQDCH